jgi:hypothetical protein
LLQCESFRKVPVHARMNSRLDSHLHFNLYELTYTHTHTFKYIQTYIYLYIWQKFVCTHTFKYIQTCIYLYIRQKFVSAIKEVKDRAWQSNNAFLSLDIENFSVFKILVTKPFKNSASLSSAGSLQEHILCDGDFNWTLRLLGIGLCPWICMHL